MRVKPQNPIQKWQHLTNSIHPLAGKWVSYALILVTAPLLSYSTYHTLTCTEHGSLASIFFTKNLTPTVAKSHKTPAIVPPKETIVTTAPKEITKVKKQPKKPKLKEQALAIIPINQNSVDNRVGKITNEENFDTLAILDDPDNLISKPFSVPDKLKRRVGFWLKIYTKYSNHHHVIHHTRYPWIILDVVDTSNIEQGPGHKWTKYHKAKKIVRNRRNHIKNRLRSLAKRKSFRSLKGLDRQLYNRLKPLRGKRKYVMNVAASNLRSQLGQREFFLGALVNSSKYLPFIESEFKRQRLPKELTRLPFVESSFNEAARSKVGASGIWQIMPQSTRDGLIYNKYIDERNNPFKATLYAAKHLKRDYRILKNWSLAVTAYNHGIGNLRKAKRKYKANSITEMIIKNKSRAFGFASKNFFTSFLAVIHAEAYHQQIFKDVSREASLKVASVRLKKSMKPRSVLKAFNLSAKEFYHYNLDLRGAMKSNRTLPKGLRIYFPYQRVKLESSSRSFTRPRRLSYFQSKASDWQMRASL